MEKLALFAPGYVDYYDHWFERADETPHVWNRNGRDDFPPRSEAFAILRDAGFRTPLHGPLRELRAGVGKDALVVVYEDETEHQGLGKHLLPLETAREAFGGDVLASAYIKPPGHAESIRYLMIGDGDPYLIRYESQDDWRSNVLTTAMAVIPPAPGEAADVRVKMLGIMRRYAAPLLAIDLVPDASGLLYATDLNLAPGLRGSGIEDVVRSREVVRRIKEAYFAWCADGVGAATAAVRDGFRKARLQTL